MLREKANVNTSKEINVLLSYLYSDWGNSLCNKKEYELCYEKYDEAIKINPKNDSAFDNWGVALSDLAKLKGDETLFKESFEKFEVATKINPKNDSAFYNWGSTLIDLAKLKGDETLYKESFEKFEEATKINPKDDSAFYNWGIALTDLAKLKGDETLYKESFEKFEEAIKINPKNDNTFDNWCTALASYASLLTEEKRLQILSDAKEKGEKSRDLGGSVYNLSCVHALLKEKQQALEYLEESLRKDINVEHVVTDEDWKEYYQDEDFKKIIEKYKKK
jgi:tetratricopeptide (TPR) repeat protein